MTQEPSTVDGLIGCCAYVFVFYILLVIAGLIGMAIVGSFPVWGSFLIGFAIGWIVRKSLESIFKG